MACWLGFGRACGVESHHRVAESHTNYTTLHYDAVCASERSALRATGGSVVHDATAGVGSGLGGDRGRRRRSTRT